MKLHMKELRRELRKAKEEETTPSSGLNPYLLEKVLRPTIEGNTPTLSEIDYDQFDEEDISALSDYCDRLRDTSTKLEQFVGAVAAIPAIPCRSRQFC